VKDGWMASYSGHGSVRNRQVNRDDQ
jgi:hypothetical protein